MCRWDQVLNLVHFWTLLLTRCVIFVNSFFAGILVDVQVLALVESVFVKWIFPYLEKLAVIFTEYELCQTFVCKSWYWEKRLQACSWWWQPHWCCCVQDLQLWPGLGLLHGFFHFQPLAVRYLCPNLFFWEDAMFCVWLFPSRCLLHLCSVGDVQLGLGFRLNVRWRPGNSGHIGLFMTEYVVLQITMSAVREWAASQGEEMHKVSLVLCRSNVTIWWADDLSQSSKPCKMYLLLNIGKYKSKTTKLLKILRGRIVQAFLQCPAFSPSLK